MAIPVSAIGRMAGGRLATELEAGVGAGVSPSPGGRIGGAPQPAAQPQPAAPEAPTIATSAVLAAAAANPAILGTILRPPPIIPPILPPVLAPKTTTQLAQGALAQLKAANPAMLTEAINTTKNSSVAPDGLIDYLERKVKVGEVLRELAKDWSDTTRTDFADAFRMDPGKLDVMDAIVSLAILNDRDLEEQVLAENMPAPGTSDLLENRRVVWQYPPAGTALTPPYLILVAVEYQDVAKAEDVVQSITGELTSYQGFKLPKAAAQKL